MADLIVGKYRLTYGDNQNFEAFMKGIGVGLVKRKLALTSKPDIIVSENDGVWSIKTVSAIKTVEIKFRFGEEFSHVRIDDKTVKSVITREGNKLIEKQKDESGQEVEVIREFDEDKFYEILKVDDVVAKRTFERYKQ